MYRCHDINESSEYCYRVSADAVAEVATTCYLDQGLDPR